MADDVLPGTEAEAVTLSLTEAAPLLGISIPTLSRQVKAGIIPNRGTATRPRVIVEEARAARLANLNPIAGQANHAKPAAVNVASRLTQLREEREALELEERRKAVRKAEGELIETAAVERAGQTAAGAFRDAVMAVPSRLAGELAGLTDPGRIAARMTTELEGALDVLDADLAAIVDGLGPPEGAG